LDVIIGGDWLRAKEREEKGIFVVTVRNDGYAEFKFYRPEANQVHLAGDFNNWRGEQMRMVKHADGNWVLRVKLAEGDYKFRYVADGVWFTDFAAFGVEPGRFGLDSICRIQGLEESATEAPARAVAA
jgi:1,4-alpha-glucan branching enzyme